MVIWVLFTHIKNIFNGSIMTSPRPKCGEALVAGGLAYSSDVIAHTQMVAKMKTWAAVRRSSCFPRSILIRGQQVSAPVDIHKKTNNLLDILIDQEFSNLRCQRIARGWRG